MLPVAELLVNAGEIFRLYFGRQACAEMLVCCESMRRNACLLCTYHIDMRGCNKAACAGVIKLHARV